MSNYVYEGNVLRSASDDVTRTVTLYNASGVQTSQRPYTQAENTVANALRTESARLSDLETRLAHLEALVSPPPKDPTVITDPAILTWATLKTPNVWPNGGLLNEASVIYRNVSGVPLTDPPSKFPGDPKSWAHLFIAVLGQVDPPPTGTPWSGAGVAYVVTPVASVVTYLGNTYRCRQAHTSQPGWDPVTVGSLWILV